MIHYMLLPKEEMKLLRKEYRLRFAIVALFALSSIVTVGILSLIPSYLHVWGERSAAMARYTELERNRRASGAEERERELNQTQVLAEKIISDNQGVQGTSLVEKILAHRRSSITLNSFTIVRDVGTSTLAEAKLEGRASTREALLEFKRALEKDRTWSSVELPLSDLAKSRNISFSVKLKQARN
jgi:hypothetical protein